LQSDPPLTYPARSELDAYQSTLAQAILADEVGFHSVWSVEHHFLELKLARRRFSNRLDEVAIVFKKARECEGVTIVAASGAHRFR